MTENIVVIKQFTIVGSTTIV